MKKIIPISIVCLIAAIAIASCSSSYYTKRDVKQLEGLSLQYTTEFYKLSNKLNPCFTEPAKSDTVIKHSTDTIFNSLERFITGKPGKPDTIFLPGKTIRINMFTVIHDSIADNRALNTCLSISKASADSLLVMKTKGAQLRADKSSLIKWLIALSVVILSFVAFKVSKFLSGGAVLGVLKKVI
jgi:hypothetical protein